MATPSNPKDYVYWCVMPTLNDRKPSGTARKWSKKGARSLENNLQYRNLLTPSAKSQIPTSNRLIHAHVFVG